MATGLDANILLRYVKRSHPQHAVVRDAVRELRRQGDPLVMFSQGAYEFWSVGTRPPTARGGFGLSLPDADRFLSLLTRLFPMLPDTPAVYDEWRRLIVAHGVSGVQVHDARIAAALRVHGVTRLLTFNTGDFARYPGFTAVDPSSV